MNKIWLLVRTFNDVCLLLVWILPELSLLVYFAMVGKLRATPLVSPRSRPRVAAVSNTVAVLIPGVRPWAALIPMWSQVYIYRIWLGGFWGGTRDGVYLILEG